MKLLLVEDEERLVRVLAKGLREEGHQVDTCMRGDDAIAQGSAIEYDVIILDWMLPDVDGLTVLRTWRSHGLRTPVLMLTARGAIAERVTGLRTGADDYMVKPFEFDELLARLEALRRRAVGDATREVGDLVLDARRRSLLCGTTEVALTAREYALALALFERSGDVCTRSHLLTAVWGSQFDGDPNVVDVYVGYLRRKLAETGATVASIRTVRGHGFCIEAAQPAAEPAR